MGAWSREAALEKLLLVPALLSPGVQGWKGVPVIAAVRRNNHSAAVINGSSLTFTYRFPSRGATSRTEIKPAPRKSNCTFQLGGGGFLACFGCKIEQAGLGLQVSVSWGGSEEGDTQCPLHVAPAHSVVPVSKGRVLG